VVVVVVCWRVGEEGIIAAEKEPAASLTVQ
jgi:hypothetical protein